MKKKLGRRKTTKDGDDEHVTLAAEDGQSILPSGQTQGDIVAAKSSAKTVFDAHGTKFLSPICFGVLPLFPSDEADQRFAWPNGSSQMMDLFAFPSTADTQDDFIERLAHIVNPTHTRANSSAAGGGKGDIRPISGHAAIFSSIVGVDITQVLIQEPELAEESTGVESENRFAWEMMPPHSMKVGLLYRLRCAFAWFAGRTQVLGRCTQGQNPYTILALSVAQSLILYTPKLAMAQQRQMLRRKILMAGRK